MLDRTGYFLLFIFYPSTAKAQNNVDDYLDASNRQHHNFIRTHSCLLISIIRPCGQSSRRQSAPVTGASIVYKILIELASRYLLRRFRQTAGNCAANTPTASLRFNRHRFGHWGCRNARSRNLGMVASTGSTTIRLRLNRFPQTQAPLLTQPPPSPHPPVLPHALQSPHDSVVIVPRFSCDRGTIDPQSWDDS